jgi:hypothetical protein
MRRRDLNRHLSVIERVFSTTTVLPFPFGTVVDDERALRAGVLEARSHELRQALDRLRGRSQFNVKAQYDEESILREVVRDEPSVRRLRDDARKLGEAGHFARIRLGELVTQSLQARRGRDAARIVARLREVCDDLALDEARDELTVMKGSFLVEDVARFDEALEELASGDGGRLRYDSIGPLPPAAFAAEAAGVGG